RTPATRGGPGLRLGGTATAGTYSVSALAPGDYTVSATKDGYTTATTAAGAIVSAAGTSLSSPATTLALLQHPSLTISLTSDVAPNPDVDDANVTAINSGTGAVLVLAWIGSGAYELTSGRPATYPLQ